MNPELVPVITFVGKSGTGKTTFLEQLIPVLKAQGLRIAVLKHDAHHFEMDRPGKDTYRFTAAGADVVTISNAEKFAMIEQPPEELTLRDIITRLPQVDLVLTEGYKKSRYPKIEIHRAALNRPLIADPAPGVRKCGCRQDPPVWRRWDVPAGQTGHGLCYRGDFPQPA